MDPSVWETRLFADHSVTKQKFKPNSFDNLCPDVPRCIFWACVRATLYTMRINEVTTPRIKGITTMLKRSGPIDTSGNNSSATTRCLWFMCTIEKRSASIRLLRQLHEDRDVADVLVISRCCLNGSVSHFAPSFFMAIEFY